MTRSRTIAALFHRRWCLPILAELHRGEGGGGGARFVTLCHRLSANQTAVRQSLDHLKEVGWVRRNPGYGHPLRPEYILTSAGERLAAPCAAIDDALELLGIRELGLRRWSMPIVHAVSVEEPARFSRVGGRLDTITDRALSQSIRNLCNAEIIARKIDDGYPPTPVYLLDKSGQRLAPLLQEIAR